MKKLFIIMPMSDKTPEYIKQTREHIHMIVEDELGEKVELIDSFFEDAPHDNPLWLLGKTIQLLSTADIVYCACDWYNYRGCKIEHECAVQYGIPIL